MVQKRQTILSTKSKQSTQSTMSARRHSNKKKDFGLFQNPFLLARPEGLEPPTYGFEARRSIQLSYGRTASKSITRHQRLSHHLVPEHADPFDLEFDHVADV